MIDEATVRWWAAQVPYIAGEAIPETWIAEAWALPFGRGRSELRPLLDLLLKIGWQRSRARKDGASNCAWHWYALAPVDVQAQSQVREHEPEVRELGLEVGDEDDLDDLLENLASDE